MDMERIQQINITLHTKEWSRKK